MDLKSNADRIEHINNIEDYAESYIESFLNEFLYKTSKDLRTDIIGFGEKLIPKYLTLNEWQNVKWLSLYRDSFFDVDVDVMIESSSLSIKE